MEYTLKDKLSITKEFLNDLEVKSWQEIEHLQNQIANIEDNKENKPLIQLLKNLLTSYYIFTGGLENLSDEKAIYVASNTDEPLKVNITDVPKAAVADDNCLTNLVFDTPNKQTPTADTNVAEPFEYFVDFDEPIGEPLTDEDLYNN